MQTKLTILTLVVIFLTAACMTVIQPAKASTEEVATSASIAIQPENIIPGQPFTVVVQINPHPPAATDVFYNIFVTVISAAQGVSGYGPWSAGSSSSDVNGIASFTFPGTVSATLGETGGGNIEVGFPGQYFGNTTIVHYQAGDWQKNFLVTASQTPTPQPTATIPKPSVPEFTAQFAGSSLEVTIKNQPEPLMAMVSNTSLYYGFRFKDHMNIQDWNYAPLYYVLPSTYGTYYKASDSEYTVVSFPLGKYPLTGILSSGQIDMQVVALIGNEVPTNYENGTVYTFIGATSGWSNIQTVAIPLSPSPTINSGQHTLQAEPLTILVVALIVVAVIIASVILYRSLRGKKEKEV